jgi:hypothetical protein
LRRWVVIVAAAAILGPLLVACSSPSPDPSPSGPQPLTTPNGEPKNEGLHGLRIPGDIWFDGHAYGNVGIVAHLQGSGHPAPSFLTPAGLARYAYSDSRGSPLEPEAWGSGAFPVYEHWGVPTQDAVVAEFGLMGDRGFYTLYWQFNRE